jgi:hypothetical protein
MLMACSAEMAKSIYANISQEKMELLRFLKTNEEVRMHEQGRTQEQLQERIDVSRSHSKGGMGINLSPKALGLVHEIARQQHDSLESLIARSATQEDQAYARLLQSVEELRNTGEGWWEEVRRRVQEQLDLDVVNARTVMDVQVAEMRGLVSGADDGPQ